VEPPSPTIDVPVVLELFALDTAACTPCVSAMACLHAAAAALSHELTGSGYIVATRVILLENPAHAAELGICSSPTVRVDGHDIALAVHEEACPNCSSVAGVSIDCRTYEWDGQRFDHPPVPLILDAVHQHLVSGARRPATQTLATSQPSSVERFLTVHGPARD
jgi:hypothetical protein